MSTTRRELLLVLPFYAGLAVLFTWPLAAHLKTQIPGTGNGVGALTGLYVLSWGFHALSTNPLQFFQANVFYPHAESLAFNDHLFGVALPMLPIQWIVNNATLALNLAVLFSFVAAGVGAYFLARQLTGSVRAGLVCGIVFAFSPFRILHLGQVSLLALHWLPWIFLVGHLYTQSQRRRLIYLGVFFALAQIVSCTYSLAYLALAALLAVMLGFFLSDRRPDVLLWRHRLHVVVATSLLAMIVLPFLRPYMNHELELATALRAPRDATGDAPAWLTSGLDVSRLVSGGLASALLKDESGTKNPIWPGVVATFLIVALPFGLKRATPAERRNVLFYGVLGLAAVLLALGPRLYFGGLVSLCVAVLAALSYRRLEVAAAPIPRGTFVISGLLLAAAVELYRAPVSLFDVTPPGGPPPVYFWLERTEPLAAIVELPSPGPDGDETPESARRQLYSTYHWHPTVDGVAPWVPPLTRSIRNRLQTFPDDHAIAQIRALRVDFVLLHLDQYAPGRRPGLLAEVNARRELHFERQIGETIVYRAD